MNKQPTVYILASKRNDTLYIGVISDKVFINWFGMKYTRVWNPLLIPAFAGMQGEAIRKNGSENGNRN